MTEPRHRADVPVNTNQVQLAGRHVANRTLERLGAEAPDVRELMGAAVLNNPFRRGAMS